MEMVKLPWKEEYHKKTSREPTNKTKKLQKSNQLIILSPRKSLPTPLNSHQQNLKRRQALWCVKSSLIHSSRNKKMLLNQVLEESIDPSQVRQ
jgi:hypothetical protein